MKGSAPCPRYRRNGMRLALTAVLGLMGSLGLILVLLWSLGFSGEQMRMLFAHPVSGGTGMSAAAAVRDIATTPDIARAGLTAWDYAVMAVYLGIMLTIGWLAGRGVRTARGLFLGGGRMHFFLAGISLLGAYLSALTMMGLPGMSFGEHDWTYMVQLPFLALTGLIIVGFILPRYREAEVVSIYQYLEMRQHVVVRLLASTSFLIFAVGRLGLVLYLPSLVLHTVAGLPLAGCIVAMGLVVTAYTALGGLKAAIWTDVMQVSIFVLGALFILAQIFGDIGVDGFLQAGLAGNKFRLLVLSSDFHRITSLWLVLETIYQTVRIYGTQQDMAQFYLSTPSTAKAANCVWMAVLLYIPLGFLFYFMGTAFFAFFEAFPDPNLPPKPDQIMPYFVVRHLPAGLAGLLLAAIFAAAMSSLDACMNSASTVCVEDFVRRFSRRIRPERFYLRLSRSLILVWGALMILTGLLFMEVQYAQIVWGKLMGFCTNGVLGLMLLAFLPWRVDWRASAAGFVLSYVCLVLAVRGGINFLLWPVIGNTVCFLAALLFNWMWRGGAGRRNSKIPRDGHVQRTPT